MKHFPAPPSPSGSWSRRQSGMTLVELLVSLAIGMVLVAGLALMFANTSQSSAELDKSVRQIESGRYAVDLMAEEISVAGYFGAAPVFTATATVSPCSSSTAVATSLESLRAASPAKLPVAVEGLTAGEAAALSCLTNYKTGTPALVIRRLDTTTVPTSSVTSGVVYVQTSNNAGDANASYIAATSTASFVLRDKDGSINAVRRYVSRVYFVATCSDCGADTIPTLKRAELSGNQIVVTPLAEGVDQVGFDFGFDTNNDGNADQWLGLNGTAAATESAAAAALGWGNVVGVRVYLVTRATEASAGFQDSRTYASGMAGTATTSIGPFTDSIKRRAYTTTARLHSVAGPREQP